MEKLVVGSYNVAKVYASIAEEEALNQIRDLCDKEWASDSHIAIMPDTHAGAGCTIGTTMTLHGKVSPQLVGVDIGCGMHVVELGNVEINLEELDNVIHSYIPSGKEVHETPVCYFDELSNLKANIDEAYAQKSLGTLGGGNHFIEVDIDEDNNKYLVIHTGSRNLGIRVCEYHQEIADAIEYNPKPIIERLKASGQQMLISDALKQYRETCKAKHYLSGESYENYLHDMRITQRYAELNRQIIANTILSKMGLTAISEWETIHNYIDLESNTLRKGAVSAKSGEKLLIPINMKEGSLICIGKGNKSWNCSAPHGAGRLMSRSKAHETLNLEEFKQSMSNIYSSTVCESTLDEAPMAYKPIEVITEDIKETVEIVKVIKPIYNYKATN